MIPFLSSQSKKAKSYRLNYFIICFLLFFLSSNAYASAIDDNFSTVMNTKLSANILTNDTGTFKEVIDHSEPSHGTILNFYENGDFEYMPDYGYVGTDTFTYKIKYFNFGWHTSTATVTINITNTSPISDTSDICYNDLELSGICVELGFCAGGLTCKKTYPLQIKSSLNNVKIFYNETGLSGSFGDSCGTDPSGTCQTVHNIDFGPFGFFNQATEFDMNSLDQNTNNPDIWTQNLINMSCFYDDRLYVTYEKDGVIHQGKLEKCTQDISNKLRDFSIRNPEDTRNIKGNIKFIGNTVLEYNGDNSKNLTNTDLNLQYIDIDSDPNTYNSSKALLDIPNDSTIVWAGLYTQGYLNGITSVNEIYEKLNDPIYLTAPSLGTISVTPDVIDYADNDGYGYTYDTYTEIKQIEGKTASEINGWITTANIKCYEGADKSGLGNFGAWTLVVIYKNPNEKLKNISVFDGYKVVYNKIGYETVNIPINGFLTPLHGDINSTLSLFVGEGDKYIEGDKLYINDIGINTINAFDSSISGVTRDPSIINNQGIDIQNHDISSLINNGDTEATITLTSEGDKYFPSVVAFATDLYEPRVCYYIDKITDENNQTVYENKNFIQDLVQNQKYKISLWIANMKKDSTDTDIETAKNVKISVDYKNFNYVQETTFIKNTDFNNFIHITDALGDDIGEFVNDLNQSDWRLGDGATSTSGGTLYPTLDFSNDNDKAFIDINGTFVINDNTTTINLDDIFIFKASYKTDFLEIANPIPIPKCQDFNTIGDTYVPTFGSFNVVNKDYIDGTMVPKDENSSINALYTQIANNLFEVKAVSLDSDMETPKNIDALVGIDLIKNPTSETECQTNPALWENNVTFVNQSSKSLTLSYPKANKNLRFRVKYLVDRYGSIVDWRGKCSNSSTNTTYNDYACIWGVLTGEVYDNSYCNEGNGYPEDKCPCALECNPATNSSPNHNDQCVQCVFNNPNLTQSICSRDNFAIRPDKFNIINIPTNIRAGNEFNITIQAVDINNQPVEDYNETLAINSATSPELDYNETNSSQGCITGTISTTSSLTFKNGEVNITLNYNEVGDLNLTTKELIGTEYAKVDTKDSTINKRFITQNSQILSIIPDHFSINAAFKDFTSNFTYLSNNINDSMAAILDLNITAKNKQNITTKNYNSTCYAKKSNYNITYTPLFITGLTKIIYQEKNTSTTGDSLMSNNNFSLTNISKDVFAIDNNGTANVKIKINFDRNSTTAVNPFKFTINDINVTDENNTQGSISLDQNTTFYYGRVHAPDYSSSSNIINNAKIYYEVYCKDCNKSNFTSLGVESIDGVYWYVNKDHNSSNSGQIYGYPLTNTTPTNLVNITPVSSTISGVENTTITYSGNKYPYKERIDINSSSWLTYNPYNQNAIYNYFYVDFSGVGSWAGIGQPGKTVDLNISSKRSKRIEW